MQMGDGQDFLICHHHHSGFPGEKNVTVLQTYDKNTNASVVRLCSHSAQEIKAFHVSHGVDNPGCIGPLFVLIFDRNCEH